MRDPFEIKRHPKWHPSRMAFTLGARLTERVARARYSAYSLCPLTLETAGPPEAFWDNTDVTPEQMRHLVKALQDTEGLSGSVIEVGSYRGETTRILAQYTKRSVYAVDPFLGYGGNEIDYAHFRRRTDGLNVVHLRMTSGKAAREWNGPISFIFIDAVHDYVNTTFDISAWTPNLVPGGILALHDVDLPHFAGTRRAAFEANQRMTLYAHPENLAIFQKPIRETKPL